MTDWMIELTVPLFVDLLIRVLFASIYSWTSRVEGGIQDEVGFYEVQYSIRHYFLRRVPLTRTETKLKKKNPRTTEKTIVFKYSIPS